MENQGFSWIGASFRSLVVLETNSIAEHSTHVSTNEYLLNGQSSQGIQSVPTLNLTFPPVDRTMLGSDWYVFPQ